LSDVDEGTTPLATDRPARSSRPGTDKAKSANPPECPGECDPDSPWPAAILWRYGVGGLLAVVAEEVIPIENTEDALARRAYELLRDMCGEDAYFRDDQLAAIVDLVRGRRKELLVKRTGWGKSMVYFIATKLIRESRGGITLLISPLLSLMRNQIEMANKLVLRAETNNSSNEEDWAAITGRLQGDACDILMIAPERLANEQFQTRIISSIQGGIGLLVVDEAHCISDWGHDFRPNYRRIVNIVRVLPGNVPLLATTATANKRVVQDIEAQFGPNLTIRRGALARPSLRLQNIRLADQGERLAWLAGHLPTIPGTGIIYCLTVRDCVTVAKWLQSRGVDAQPYFADLPTERKEQLERDLLTNNLKALVATVSLGMGFDKPDLGFVVHFQRPGSVVAYYQQVGRAGRAVPVAFAVLLNGREDDEIQEYFIQQVFPPMERMREVLEVIASSDSLSIDEIMSELNLPKGQVVQCLQFLQIESAVVQSGGRYMRSANPWNYDPDDAARVTALRQRELERMKDYVLTQGCLMEFVSAELDDEDAAPCGTCANCAGPRFSSAVDSDLVREAIRFLRRTELPFEPRKQWPRDVVPGLRGNIPTALRNSEGRALCVWEDAGWGQLVKRSKYEFGRVADEIVAASVELIQNRWRPEPTPEWLTVVPSRRSPDLLLDFGQRLAAGLGIEFRPALVKVKDTLPQKSRRNSQQQLANVAEAFSVDDQMLLFTPVLLVDDIYNSGWSLTLCGIKLREHGVPCVHPFVLAMAHA